MAKNWSRKAGDGRHDRKGKNASIKGHAVGDPKIQEEKQETACKVVRVLTVGAILLLLLHNNVSFPFLPIPGFKPHSLGK